jgi:hypothetical protein
MFCTIWSLRFWLIDLRWSFPLSLLYTKVHLFQADSSRIMFWQLMRLCIPCTPTCGVKLVGFMGIKFDMSKTYDRVKWHFLEAVMRNLGFSERWITLVMICVKSTSYAINGHAVGNIQPTRGLCQRNLLVHWAPPQCALVLCHCCALWVFWSFPFLISILILY